MIVHNGDLKGIYVGPTTQPLTILLFVDDILLFGEGKYHEAYNLIRILYLFCRSQGKKLAYPSQKFG